MKFLIILSYFVFGCHAIFAQSENSNKITEEAATELIQPDDDLLNQEPSDTEVEAILDSIVNDTGN